MLPMITESVSLQGHGRGNKSGGDNFHAAPNIDRSQDFVRRDIKNWLRWMRLVSLYFVLFSSHLIHYLDSHAKKLGMIDGGLTFVRGVLEG
ncbi:hypothetical protein YC2023_016445 [Brassica napus]